MGTQMTERRLSQAISEGDGISVIVAVEEPGAARDAEQAGAEAVLVQNARSERLASIRDATELPILVFFSGEEAEQLRGADACIVDVRDDDRDWLESVRLELADRFELAPRICKDEHLEFVLEEFDPEVLVLGSAGES